MVDPVYTLMHESIDTFPFLLRGKRLGSEACFWLGSKAQSCLNMINLKMAARVDKRFHIYNEV